jgi:hypothetical protein
MHNVYPLLLHLAVYFISVIIFDLHFRNDHGVIPFHPYPSGPAAQEDWVPKAMSDARECLDTATHLFNYVKASMPACCQLSNGKLFYDVYCVYKQLFRGFINLLSQHVASFEPQKDRLVDVQYLSLALCANTAAYCSGVQCLSAR